ncbi:hypothetical protein GWI33_013318 [Rhynchophorus ferrugineus]|uniref:Uncharacterized protein n=1 Tax=Rhynchophorus ferrugineus TaxID=354439 RepID=A0A834I7C7_RHYFE|nr:hypothetical protein GWI33_013318 [Rhynchophorus ferrugineus]
MHRSYAEGLQNMGSKLFRDQFNETHSRTLYVQWAANLASCRDKEKKREKYPSPFYDAITYHTQRAHKIWEVNYFAISLMKPIPEHITSSGPLTSPLVGTKKKKREKYPSPFYDAITYHTQRAYKIWEVNYFAINLMKPIPEHITSSGPLTSRLVGTKKKKREKYPSPFYDAITWRKRPGT